MKKILLAVAGAVTALGIATAAHSGPRLDKIMDNKVIRVGTPGDYRPFSIKNNNGTYEGHDIDVITAMAKELNVDIQYIDTSWPTLLDDLKSNKFDVAVGGITRTSARIGQIDMLPGYAPFGKVALVRKSEASKYNSVDDLNQSSVHVIKNPGGTNEQFVLEHLTNAKVSTHENNAEIPGLIAEGDGDVMITETFEALHYSNEDERLKALFIEDPLTPKHELGFMVPIDDEDFIRVMRFAWDLMETRGVVKQAADKWLK